MTRRIVHLLAVLLLTAPARVHTQNTGPLEFDVVSIKRHTQPTSFGGMRTLPDGTFIGENVLILGILGNASPLPGILLGNIVGLPDWTKTESI